MLHCVLYLAALLGPLALAAASPPDVREYGYRVWRTQEGLPQSRIQAITQTYDGYLWVGTLGGLVRFDGIRFFVYDRSNTPALLDDSILSLCASQDGSLWVGTEGGGLVHYANGSFKRFGAPEGLQNLFVRSLHQDRRGTLWVGTDRGIFRLDSQQNLIRLDGKSHLPVASAATIFEELNGKLWFGGALGLFFIEDGQLRQHSAFPDVRDIEQTRDRNLWFATAAGLKRLVDGKLTGATELANANVRQVVEDRNGELWVGLVGGGLVRMQGPRAQTIALNEAMPDTTVLALHCDRQENLWIGTQDGLVRLRETVVKSIMDVDGLSNENVSTIYEDPSGGTWITTIRGDVYRMQNGRAAPYHVPGAPADFRAATIYVDSNGAVWIGSVEGGIARVQGNGQVRFFGLNDGMRNDRARQFLEDGRGNLWIAAGSGLIRWDGQRFHNYYLQEGLAYGSVRVLLKLRSGPHAGDVLAGTDGGLNRIHGTRLIPRKEWLLLAGEKIWTLLEDRDGVVWIGTRGSGLFRLKDGAMTKLTTRHGLLSNSVYQVLEDGNGRLWMSSPAGIFSAKRHELNAVADGMSSAVVVLPYGTAEGLRSTQMNGGFQSAGLRVRSGELWFPSVKGVVRIDPERVRATNVPVVIERVVHDDVVLPPHRSVAVIPAGSRKLQIDYTAANLASPERVAFRYKLEGFDEDWTHAASSRTAHYANLRPGQYTFRVIATDATSAGAPSEATVNIDWQPRVYETKWFLAFLAAALGGSILLGLQLYAVQTRRRYAVMLAERSRLAREMHDTVIQGCVGVSTLLEAAGSSQRTDPATDKLLEEARTQLRITLDDAREAVWDLRNPVKRHGLPSTLAEFAARLSGGNGVELKAHVEGEPVPLNEKANRSLLLVAREAIRNAMTHAGAKRVDVCLRFEASAVRLEIRDNGRGFDPAVIERPERVHYGLIGMRERVEQLRGTLEIRSAPGEGTVVSASVPLPPAGEYVNA